MKKIISWVAAHLTLLYIFIGVVVTSVLILLMFPNTARNTQYNYTVGSFWADNDLFAPYDFTVVKDVAKQQRAIDEAKRSAILYYTEDSTAYRQAQRRLEECMLSRAERQRLAPLLGDIYRKGYIQIPADYDSLQGHTLVLLRGNVGEERNASDFITTMQVYELVEDRLQNTKLEERVRLSRLLVDSVLQYSVCYDAVRSRLEIDSRLSQSMVGSEMIQRGALVVSKGEYIDEETARVLQALEKENEAHYSEHYNVLNHNIGQLLLFFVAFTALLLFLNNTKNEILGDTRKMTFILVTVLLMAGIVALLTRLNSDWVLLAPLCVAPILMHVFFDMRVALYVHLTIVILLGSLVPNSFEFIFYQVIAGMMSIITVRNFERRSNFFTVALIIFCSYALVYTCGKLSQDTNLHSLDYQRYLIFFLNALLTLLAYPLIYLFERIFGLTTDLTLQEISSTNTPALRLLSRQAPGTFQHSMQVANISEDIISEIGGNALLARVGALYHDIGKANNPLYFTENQNAGFNPHDNLDYEESARIITRHVLDGIALGKKYGLPREVVDFIRTHHGTTHTGYFYMRWMQEHPGETPDEEIFAYCGPKPYTREMAVVMMVDSVEAASRSLPSPNKENLGKLIDAIIDGKIKDDQLSNCNITFGEITRIREALKEKMMNIYHVRIAYPVVAAPTEQKQ